MKKSIYWFFVVLLYGSLAFATTPPALLFSDIISGPKTGLNDGLGSGAIVTVWGTNLGGSQGASTITIDGVAAAHVYYWENADPANGDSGPSDMYTYHKMQEIALAAAATLQCSGSFNMH